MEANSEQARPDRRSLRDAGLRRIRRVSRWLAGGAVVLTGAFAGLAASATKHSSATADGAGSQQVSQQQPGDDGEGFDDGGARLQAPTQAPGQAPGGAVPQTSSGAS